MLRMQHPEYGSGPAEFLLVLPRFTIVGSMEVNHDLALHGILLLIFNVSNRALSRVT